jgi:hypothetical protein
MQNLRILKFGGSVPRDFFLSGFHSKLSQLEEIVNPTSVVYGLKTLHREVIDALERRAITIRINNPQDLTLPTISFLNTGVRLVCEDQNVRGLEIRESNKMSVLFSGGSTEGTYRNPLHIIGIPRSSEGVTRIRYECYGCIFDPGCIFATRHRTTPFSWRRGESVATEAKVEIDVYDGEMASILDEHSNCKELQIHGKPSSILVNLPMLEKLNTENAPSSSLYKLIHIYNCADFITVHSEEKCGLYFAYPCKFRKVTVDHGITSLHAEVLSGAVVELTDEMDDFHISTRSLSEFTLEGRMPKALKIGATEMSYAHCDSDDTWHALRKDVGPPEGFTVGFPPPGTEVRVARFTFDNP